MMTPREMDLQKQLEEALAREKDLAAKVEALTEQVVALTPRGGLGGSGPIHCSQHDVSRPWIIVDLVGGWDTTPH